MSFDMRYSVNRFLKDAALLMVLCLACTPRLFAQQLQELVITKNQDQSHDGSIYTEFPDYTYLVINSTIPNLTFESSYIIYADLTDPGSGRYVLVLAPQRQRMRISVPGEYLVTEIMLDHLAAKVPVYYTVEPANLSRFVEIIQLYEAGRYQEAINKINGYILTPNLSENQRKEAYYLLGKSLFALEQMAEMKTALRRLLALAPDFEPNSVGDPEEITQFIVQYQDSVKRLPPAAPRNLRAYSIGDQIRLEWDPNTESDLAGYRIYKGLDPLQKRFIATTSAVSTTYLDPDVTPFQTYYYHVTAFDSPLQTGESAASNTKEVETLPPLSKRIKVELDDPSALKAVQLQDQGDSLLIISYHLTDAIKRTYDISMTLSNGRLRPTAFTGDYGENIQDGPFKRIQWNVRADFPAGLSEAQYVMHIVATPRPLFDRLKLSADDSAGIIENVRLTAKGDSLVSILYTLPGEPKKKYNVSVRLSRNNGPFSLSPQALSGQVGAGISRGNNKEIAWEILKDFPGGLDGNYELRLLITEEVRAGRGKWWLASGGAILAGGVTAVILSNTGGTNTPGPDVVATGPPGRPN